MPTVRTGSSSGTRSTRTCSSEHSLAPVISSPSRKSPTRRTSGSLADDHRARRRCAAVVLDQPRHRGSRWDFAFVEAHTVGQDDWTTLEELNGHIPHRTPASRARSAAGSSCIRSSPTIRRDRTPDGTCSPVGSGGGVWWAATGASDGYEQWSFDLSAFAGTDIEVSISYASDEIVQAVRSVRRRCRRFDRRRHDIVRG